MLRLVSVETGLDDIKAHLSTCGYEVVDMADCVRPVEAVVYTGEPGAQAAAGKLAENTVMVNAAGLTAEQVASVLAERLG
ncbi:hypothetical protein TcarDRAFT_0897 [Thermosinus carboxydivorans Nor1]|uniref:YkuS family protein n=1 Tax=Thermosinus carboxydivorans Nor1 TaxID=401526 RepID=A1HSM5_9FIRM|nr:YkuS family protein [Thermosinus carboxydivorans]EAX46995.1 hypothetical protein TcarDRAFT_0897 [Thermosinus carboxydivorans Nor1]